MNDESVMNFFLINDCISELTISKEKLFADVNAFDLSFRLETKTVQKIFLQTQNVAETY